MTWKSRRQFDQEQESLSDFQKLKWLSSLCAVVLITIAPSMLGTKVPIDDISDRMAMPGDVTGRVELMKRDLADLMLSVRAARECASSAQQPDAHRPNLNAAQQKDWSELSASMEKMHTAMASVERSGDSDVDFVTLMLPHHQAAIDMARTQLLYGKDPRMRSLAQEIITDQQSEIELMQLWLKQHGPQK